MLYHRNKNESGAMAAIADPILSLSLNGKHQCAMTLRLVPTA
jgi:Tfp pilus assembly ATPase PilU